MSEWLRGAADCTFAAVSPLRRCSRTACGRAAVATLTYIYADSTAVVGPLATYAEPHSYDLCDAHADRLTAPRGWEVVRLDVDAETAGPAGDDLVALADAVREGRDGSQSMVNGVTAGFSDPTTGASGGSLMAPPVRRPEPNGRRRGHLRVLPDPESGSE